MAVSSPRDGVVCLDVYGTHDTIITIEHPHWRALKDRLKGVIQSFLQDSVGSHDSLSRSSTSAIHRLSLSAAYSRPSAPAPTPASSRSPSTADGSLPVLAVSTSKVQHTHPPSPSTTVDGCDVDNQVGEQRNAQKSRGSVSSRRRSREDTVSTPPEEGGASRRHSECSHPSHEQQQTEEGCAKSPSAHMCKPAQVVV